MDCLFGSETECFSATKRFGLKDQQTSRNSKGIKIVEATPGTRGRTERRLKKEERRQVEEVARTTVEEVREERFL